MIQAIIISDRTIQAFSWMLIHSLWQGLLLAIGAGIVLMLTRKSTAAVRYNLTLVLFSLFLLASVSTFTYEWNVIPVQHEQISSSQPVRNELNNNGTKNISFTGTVNSYVSQQSNSSYNIKAYIQTFSDYFSRNSSLIVLLWFIFFIAKSVSMAGSMLYLQRARHYQIYAPSEYWKDKVASLCEKLQLKRAVGLFESGYVKVPVVIGYLKPIILLPVGLIAGLPEAQVEAVLLHELAHIRRNDYVVNFLQNIAEAIFFFNPGLLWISAILKEERENCCDDIALEQTQNKEQFIQALISFKEYFLSNSTPVVAVAFPGQKNHLLNRVMRIVYQKNKTFSAKERGFFMAGITALAIMAFTLIQIKNFPEIKYHLSKRFEKVIPNHLKLKDREVNNTGAQNSVKGDVISVNQDLIKAWAASKQKWATRWDEISNEWNSKWAETNQKWDIVWNKNTDKWDLIWDEHITKWNNILAEAVRKGLPQNEISRIKNEKKLEKDRLRAEYDAEINDLKNKYNAESSLLRGEQRKEIDPLHIQQDEEVASMRENLKVTSPDKISQIMGNETLTEKQESDLFMERYNKIISQWKEIDSQKDEIIAKRDDLIRQWDTYLRKNPEKDAGYYLKVVGLNTQYDVKSDGLLNTYFEKSADLNAKYLRENPGKAIPFDQELADLRAKYMQKRIEINRIYKLNATDREANLEYFSKQFEQNAYFFQKSSELTAKINSNGSELNDEFIRKITQLDLELYWKQMELNDKTNQRNNEVRAENYRKKSDLEKLAINQITKN